MLKTEKTRFNMKLKHKYSMGGHNKTKIIETTRIRTNRAEENNLQINNTHKVI